MTPDTAKKIDMHFHVGLLGDEFPQWGRISDHLRSQAGYDVSMIPILGINRANR